MALTIWSYTLLVWTLAWIGGFLPLFLGRVRWRWWQCVGLALVLTPFVRMGIGVYFDLVALVEVTASGGFVVLEAVPRSAIWETIWRRVLNYLVVPGFGLFLLWGGKPTRGQVAEAGLAPRENAWRDALHGFALFFAIALAYVGALLVALFVAREFLPATGDESRVWANMTPLLIVLLSGTAGLTEEFLFRGLLLRALGRAMPFLAAASLQALFFGLIHAGYFTWTHVLGPFVFGLGMAWIVRELGLIPAVLLHAEVNVAFFAIDVADVVPAAWLLVLALLAMNAYAGWVTRFAAVRTLWRSIAGVFRRGRATASA